MLILSNLDLTPRAMVRYGFTEETEWRAALGGSAPLYVAVCAGPMDAPEWIPAGSTHGARGPCSPASGRYCARES